MSNMQNTYETEVFHFGSDIPSYFFMSKGNGAIMKAVEYEPTEDFEGYPVYNLAFGDYNLVNGCISDDAVSNNGDSRKVLYTVLDTIPRLFETLGNVVVLVRGSDSHPNFIENCRKSCSRKCNNSDCKKAHRRINIYREFVNQNFEDLNAEYIFKGGYHIDNHDTAEDYQIGEKYNFVLVMKKIA